MSRGSGRRGLRREDQAASPRRRTRALVGLLVGALAIAGAVVMASCPNVRREAGLSVLLITIDTLRADALGVYGHPTVETPTIDRLAAAGVRFEQAHAHSVLTLPSHANILSGRYPVDHGIRDNAGFRFPTGRDTLATLLKRAGYRTAAFVSAFPLDSRFGLDRGFDVYDDRFTNADTRTAFVMEERRGAETATLARDWMAAQDGAPFFCWVHLYDPHFPYDPPEPFASRFRDDPYHGEVSAVDSALGPLLEPLLEAGREGRTLVVFTADHGESLGDHGERTHGVFAYEATIRVPLIVFAPRLIRPGVARPSVRHVDILPTILDALALPVAPGLPGRSLLPLIAGDTRPPDPSYFESLSAARSRGWAPLYGMLDGAWKYVDLPEPELYDLAGDPAETRNLAAARPEVRNRLRQQLSALRSADPGWSGGRRESDEIRERLRSLGYVATAGGGKKSAYTEDDDPKRLIALDAQLQAAADRYNSGDRDGAIALCVDVLRRRPDMPEALVQLGALYRQAGRLDEAIALFRKALSLGPDDQQTAALLGTSLTEAGRASQALAVLEPYVHRPDVDIDVLMARGIAFAQGGRSKEALAAFEAVREADPTNPMAFVNIATVQLAAGDHARARESLEAAIRLNPRVARAHNALGVIAAETGHHDEAIKHWEQALELEPRDFDTVYNLGRLLWREGRLAEARPYLERFVREAPPAAYARDIATAREWLTARAARAPEPR